MPEQWRVGRRNLHTVYRQHGDEPRGYEHADHDDSLGYFRHPEDARRAVDAVNAQADCSRCGHAVDDHVDNGDGPICARMVVDHYVRGGADECGCMLPVESTTPPSCDCPTTDGAVQGEEAVDRLAWLMAAAHDDVNGQGPGGTFWWAEMKQDQPTLAAQWLTHARRALASMRLPASMLRPIDVDTDDDDTAGSAVGQRGAPTRDELVRALEVAEVVRGDADDEWHTPDTVEAERMADVALAALRDGGADGEDADGREPRCTAFHPEYGFTCPYLPNGHGRWHWDPAGGYWDAAGQYIDGAEDVAEQPDDGANASGKGAEESSYTEQVAARVRAALGADPVNEAILCDLSRAVNQVHDDLDEAMSWHRRELQRVGIALTGLMLRIDHTSGDGRRWVTVEADPETGEPLTTEHHRIAESVATHVLDETRTRLATALDVSLDPDDPDPVGRLVEAAGKAREVEVVSGCPRRDHLDSALAQIGTLPTPPVTDILIRHAKATRHLAPAPPPAALAVGEVVHDAVDLARRASVGTIVEDADTCIAKLVEEGLGPRWRFGIYRRKSGFFTYPVTVVRVGTGGGETGE